MTAPKAAPRLAPVLLPVIIIMISAATSVGALADLSTPVINYPAMSLHPSNQQAVNQQPLQLQRQHLNPYTKVTHELLLDLSKQFHNRAVKFDQQFKNLLSTTKLSLHNMFSDAYGMVYERNTEIFTEMFEKLALYYSTGQVKLTKTMQEFFERLYQKVFQVLNNNRAFTASYLDCAIEQLALLKPFKNVPDKLIEEIRHVFVSARTFNQALNHGIDVISGIISVSTILCKQNESTNYLSQSKGVRLCTKIGL